MTADFEFYRDTFKGITIASEEEYGYAAERASDELAPYVAFIPNTAEAQRALKKCACKIADIVYGNYKTSKFGEAGGKIASESVSGYYSVSYGVATGAEALRAYQAQINAALSLYLGRYLNRPAKVAY